MLKKEIISWSLTYKLWLLTLDPLLLEDKLKMMKEGGKSRTIESPTLEDMHTLADGGEIELSREEKVVKRGMDIDSNRPMSPGGFGEPAIEEE